MSISQLVRSSCESVANKSSHVKISENIISQVVDNYLLNENIEEWDVDYHYNLDAPSLGPLTCQYIFVLDCLNFCFWPNESLEYDDLAKSLKNILQNDSATFNATRLKGLTETELSSWFKGYSIPLLKQRLNNLVELGTVLDEHFDGLAINLVKSANCSCATLLNILDTHFQGFRDRSTYQGETVYLYKRAQILIGDLWAAYRKYSKDGDIFYFVDIDILTMFPDYRVPQILRFYEILSYSPELTYKIDNLIEIEKDSEEEIEIRACTVHAVELIQKELYRKGRLLKVIEIDWLLWQIGERTRHSIKPAHRTLTIFY